MSNYKVIGIDLAKRKFHYAVINLSNEVIIKKAIGRNDFYAQAGLLFPAGSTFAFEACSGSHYTAQRLQQLGHKVILLKPKDVKPYAKSRQKNDKNDSIAICKAACDPELKHVRPKTRDNQEVSYLHKSRKNIIQQRIQRSNSLITALLEFGYLVECGKSKFAKSCKEYVEEGFTQNFLPYDVYQEMLLDCNEIEALIGREKKIDKVIVSRNKNSSAAKILKTIPGIGPINASILSIKPVESYDSAKDFAASLGLVPRQNTTGGTIKLGGISKQGDRYARTQLIQAARTIVMRVMRPNPPVNSLYEFATKLKQKGKAFNLVCVAVANKLARIAYACLTKGVEYCSSR